MQFKPKTLVRGGSEALSAVLLVALVFAIFRPDLFPRSAGIDYTATATIKDRPHAHK